jgi:uncharacterized membrane protein YjgN (DUF898 family)
MHVRNCQSANPRRLPGTIVASTNTMSETTAAPPSVQRFAFTGRTTDYFRIWAVSLCLSLLTLGVYSAWGKVRKRRYLYAHSRLDSTGFDYRADPVAILKGRVMALLLFGGFALSGHFLPLVQLAFILLLVLLTPWIVVASSRFNARNTAYRNVAFAFDGGLRESARVFLGFGALTIVTLGLAYPWFRMRRARFIVERHRFGATPFKADLLAGGFLVAYLVAALMLIGTGVLSLGAIAVIGFATTVATSTEGHSKHVPEGLVLIPIVTLYVAYLFVFAYVKARVGNLTLNGAIIGRLRCRSTLRARDLAWLYASNIVAVIATVGLAVPWVTIRMARYRASNLCVVGAASMASFAAAPGATGTATGSEVGDLFDVDVSL